MNSDEVERRFWLFGRQSPVLLSVPMAQDLSAANLPVDLDLKNELN